MLRLFAGIVRYRRDRRGAAAAEFAILLTLLVIPLMNLIDIGVYAYDCMELNDAAQVAAQGVWAQCALKQKVPAAVSCTGYQSAATATANGTPLGANASITYGGTPCASSSSCSFNFFAANTPVSSMTSPGEGFACLNGGVLVSTTDQPTGSDEAQASKDGTSGGGTCTAHDYVLVEATMQNFSSIFPFPSLSIVTHLPTPQRLVLMRLD